MKIFSSTALSFLLIFLITPYAPEACQPQGQELYAIGQEYFFKEDGTTLKIDVDKENERFILFYGESQPCTDRHQFSFGFYILHFYKNNEFNKEFEYSTNMGEAVSFDEYGDFYFEGDRIFYISYANASDLVKTAILVENYYIESCDFTFIIY